MLSPNSSCELPVCFIHIMIQSILNLLQESFQLLEELNTAKQDTTHVTKDMQSSTEAQQSAKTLCC